MKILKITKQSITDAVAVLKSGGTVVYPTETSYALGCDATNERAKSLIFKIKMRPKEKDLPMICATKKQVSGFFKMPSVAWKIWKKYWPKPVSIIIKTKKHENKKTRKNNMSFPTPKRSVGNYSGIQIEVPVRISSNKIARGLARKLGRPIVSTSANISGKPSLYSATEIAKSFFGKKYQPDIILDAGTLPVRPASTIIKINDNKIEVIRKGEVKIGSV